MVGTKAIPLAVHEHLHTIAHRQNDRMTYELGAPITLYVL